MSLFRDLTYLEHIKESIGKIQSYTQSLSEEAFQESTLIQDAVVVNCITLFGASQ